ncbi:glycoside hydrolase family 27 protein [Streptomyces sp. NPDC056486]|uniref:glycoside hydrolase family 27 protein n=1 Tax=Streptomyces sp. NPDC056486 TaxID=3345835 RepID=UPI0036A49A01
MTSPRAATLGTAALAALLVAATLSPAAPAAAADRTPAPPRQPTDTPLAPTPYMGWNTYFGLGAPTEKDVKSVADFLVGSGLKESGYNIVWLDGGWQADTPRDSEGHLAANAERFPSGIPALVDYLHRRGLKAGIYTDAGTYDGGKSCGLGSRGHYSEDARQFADWKVDAIKVDFLCGIAEKADPQPAFKEFSEAVRKTGRPMLLNLCNPLTDDWGVPHTPAQDAHNSYQFGPRLADSWRTGTDVAFGTPSENQWPNILRNMDANMAHPEAQSPGHYNDPDYLIPLRRLKDGTPELSTEESTTQLVLWALMGSPLVIGSDPRTLPQDMIDTLRNPEIIGVDQDPLAIQGVRVASDATGDVYSKVLKGAGHRTVVLLNRSDTAARRTVRFADAGLTGPVRVRDLRARADRGVHEGSYTVEVPAHGTAFLKLDGKDTAPGTRLGVRSPADPAAIGRTVFSTTFSGDVVVNGASLGRPGGGRVTGKPVARAYGEGRIEVYVRATDGHLYRRQLTDGRATSGWRPVESPAVSSAPAVAGAGATPGALAALDREGGLLVRSATGHWQELGAPDGLGLYDDPAAVTDADGRVHVAVRATDSSVWTRVRATDGTWSAWTSLGGATSASPALALDGDTVRLVSRAGDYTVWQRSLAPGRGDGAWSDWSKRTEFPGAALAGAPALTGTPLTATFRGVDGQLWRAPLPASD